MAIKPNSLREEVLALPNGARADLAAELLVNLETDPEQDFDDVDRQWVNEIEGRARRALAGDATSQDWTAVPQRLSDALTE
ncbi:MAG: addiction module protein [Acidimicrobiia bacterium]|nr:addiction module protein [Acidimicrobiia bacterium]